MQESKAQEVAAALGIHIRKLQHPMRLRLAEGKLSTTVLDKALRGAELSALNGEVHEQVDQIICLPSTPPGCDMIGDRTGGDERSRQHSEASVSTGISTDTITGTGAGVITTTTCR